MGTRVPVEQIFSNSSVPVTTSPKPLSASLTTAAMIQAFIVSNPSTNANSVFLGDAGVTTTTGTEIKVGSAPLFAIQQEREFYELQDPLILLAKVLGCNPNLLPIDIPVVVWNPSNIWLVAGVAGPTTVGVQFFKNVYV